MVSPSICSCESIIVPLYQSGRPFATARSRGTIGHSPKVNASVNSIGHDHYDDVIRLDNMINGHDEPRRFVDSSPGS